MARKDTPCQHAPQSDPSPLHKAISRRQFVGGAIAAAILAGCRVTPPTLTPGPTAAPTVTPTPEPEALARVAIGRATSYDRDLIRREVRALLDGLGGLGDVIHSGDKVAIKVNLTGGSYFQPPAGYSATESYLTHPEVV